MIAHDDPAKVIAISVFRCSVEKQRAPGLLWFD